MRLGGRPTPLATLLLLALLGAGGPSAAATDESPGARAERLAAAGRCEEALPLLAEVARTTPQDGRVHLLTGQCQVRTKRYPEAVTSLERARSLDPTLPDVDLSLGIARFHAGDPAGAEPLLSAARAAGADRPELDFYEGMTRLQLGRADTATAQSLERAALAKPETLDPVASYYAGLAWRSAGEPDRARESLERVVERHPGTSWADAATRALGELELARPSFWVRAQAGVEYDDNVIFRGAGVVVPSDIGGEDDGRAVWSIELGGEPIRTRDWGVGVRATYTGSALFHLQDFDLAYPGVSLWVDRRIDDATLVRVEYGFDYAWLGYQPYVATQLVTPQWFHDFGELGVSRFWAQLLWSNYFPEDADVFPGTGVGQPCPPASVGFCGPAGIDEHRVRNRDGILYTAGVEHTLSVPLLRTDLSPGLFAEYDDARGSEYSFAGYGAQLLATSQLPLGVLLRARGIYVYRPYENVSTFPDPRDPNVLAGRQYGLAGPRRSDDFVEVDVSVERKITDNFTASVRYDYLKNHSTVAVFDYDRHLVGGYLTLFWRH
jgi:tetratricopeptide (TPR) repeat protein